MKILQSLVICAVVALAIVVEAHAEPGKAPTFLKPGSRYFLGNANGASFPYIVKIVGNAGGDWVLVESTKTLRASATEPKVVTMWINFAHVATVQEVTPEDEREPKK